MPLTSDIKAILDDYFAMRPPFSKKKKFEFPDAISIASIRLWCQQNDDTAYVVSEDPDLQACCSESGPLFHASSISEIISRATVSRELHDALVEALRDSDELKEWLAEKIKNVDIDIRRTTARSFSVKAVEIDHVDSIEILSVNVIEQQQEQFQCEVEVEAGLSLGINVSVEGYLGLDPDDYEPPYEFSVQQARTEVFYAEVIVRFEAKTGALEVESIYVGETLSVGSDDVDALY